jgi:hypothetical protein
VLKVKTFGWVRFLGVLLIGVPFLCAAPISDFLRISQFVPAANGGSFQQIFFAFRTQGDTDVDSPNALIDTQTLPPFRLIAGIVLPLKRSVMIGESRDLVSDIVQLSADVSPVNANQMVYSITLQSDAADTLGRGNPDPAFTESTILGNQVFDVSTALFGRGTEGQFPLKIEVYSCGFELASQGSCLDTSSVSEPSTAAVFLSGFALIAAGASLARWHQENLAKTGRTILE